VQVEVKKAEPRDVKLVADCQLDASSLTVDSSVAAAANDVAADDDNTVVSRCVAGTIKSLISFIDLLTNTRI